MLAHELELDDILMPDRRQRRKIRRMSTKKLKRKTRKLTKIFIGIALVIVVVGVILSFANIGGDIILGMTEKYLSENYKILLNAERITGNPIKGYTLHNFEIADENNSNQQILSAGFLSGRMNFVALLTGKIRLAEIALGKISMDVDNFITIAKNFKMPKTTAKTKKFIATAYADTEDTMPEIPLDKFSLVDSHFSSQYGVIDVKKIAANLNEFDIDIDGSINGIKLKGDIDMGENAGLRAINRSDIKFGSGKILATGGFIGDTLDFHASVEDLDLSEMTALYPEMLKTEDFDGKADFNIDVIGSSDEPKIMGSIDYKGTKIYGLPVERMSTNFNYSDNRIGLTDIQANVLNIPIQGELAAANRPNEDISVFIKLDGSEANLSGLDKVLNIPELKALSGKVSSFSANISGHINSLSGLVTFAAPRIAYTDRALTNIKAQMKLNNSDTAHVDGKFNFEGANGYIQGNVVSLLVNPKFNITTKIASLDIKRIENMIPDASDYKLAGNITASINVQGTTSDPKVSGSLNSPEFSGFGQIISKPVVNFSFANKTLTLSKTEGTLNGMPINLTGTVGPLPSPNPNLNINATIAMTHTALKSYVPDIDSYAIEGTVNAGVKIQGQVNNPAIKFLASSPNLEAMNMIKATDLELTTDINGDLAKLEHIVINAAAKKLVASGITFSNINAVLSKNDDNITLGSFNAKSGAGTITGSGVASVSGKTPLDFNFKFMNLALDSLASASGVDVKGDVSGALKISGSNTNPTIAFNANVPSLKAMGLTLNNIIANLSGNMNSIKLDKVRAEVEGAEIIALGNVQIQPSVKFNVALNGNNIKLERMLELSSADTGENLSGNIAFNFTASGNEKSIKGNGKIISSAIKAYGLNLTDVNLPISYSYPANTLASSNGTAKLYGGTAKNSLTFDINTMSFTDNIEATGFNVNSLVQDASGGLDGGKITGTGKLTMSINGSVKDKTTYSGTGNFSMGEGVISGFTWVDIISKIHKASGIKYASVNAPLTLQTGKLILKAGAMATATKDNPMYTYAKLSKNGTIDFSGKSVKMDLMTESNINYQLINALRIGSKGGLETLFNGGTVDLKSGLKAFLTDGVKEAAKASTSKDFRIVSLRIHGPVDSLSYSSLKVGDTTIKDAVTEKLLSNPEVKKKVIEVVESKMPKDVKETLKIVTTNPTKSVAPTTKTETKQAVKQAATELKKEATKKLETAVKENKTKVKEGLKKKLGGLLK